MTVLIEALSILLPTPGETALLRACLHSGESGRRARQTVTTRAGDPTTWPGEDTRRLGSLAPLLLDALRRHDAAIPPPLATHLRTAYLWERRRTEAYRQILRDVLTTLAAAGLPHIVLKGAALADTVYADPVLRHCHDIDLLVRESELSAAARLLPPPRFQPVVGPDTGGRTLRHESGLPIELHEQPFRLLPHGMPWNALWERSRTEVIAGLSARILSPADNLVQVCVQAASCRSGTSLRWAADAWHLILRHPDLDWEVVLGWALDQRLALPLALTLGYLAGEIEAPVPAIVLHRLAAEASRPDRAVRDALVAAALLGPSVSGRRLREMRGGWPSRLLVLKWRLLPPGSYVRAAYRESRSWLLPLYYLYRPLRYVARRVRGEHDRAPAT